MPRINRQISIGYYGSGAYIIVENVNSSGFSIVGRSADTDFENNNIVLRHSDIGDQGGVGIDSYTQNTLRNLVIFNNTVHERGIWDPEIAVGDRDFHCMAVGGKVSNLWILDNEMFHCEGDGLQIGDSRSSHHIYVGRNVAHHNKQSGLWTKTAYDVVFSQNVVYRHRPSSSAT